MILISSHRGDHLEVDEVAREIVPVFDPVDELGHHFGGAQIGIGREGEIDNGLDIDSIIHDVILLSFYGDSLSVIVENFAQFQFDPPKVITSTLAALRVIWGRTRFHPIVFYDLILDRVNDSQNFHSGERDHSIHLLTTSKQRRCNSGCNARDNRIPRR